MVAMLEMDCYLIQTGRKFCVNKISDESEVGEHNAHFSKASPFASKVLIFFTELLPFLLLQVSRNLNLLIVPFSCAI